MTVEMTKELAAALHATEDRELELIDPETRQRYVLVDSETHMRAMKALRRQQDIEAIKQGIREMEAGLGKPVDQAFAEIRQRLGFPPHP